jgi:diadenosine tetraphosphate (Ap4A) HIT family hydrolase
MKKKKFVNLKNARKGDYEKVISEILKTGKCPFCPETFKYHKKPIFKKRGNWFLTDNSWPYKNARIHLMIIGKKHKENLSELNQKDLKEVYFLANWAIKKYNIKGGALTIRFGETDFTGASVNHLHFHIISPKSKKAVNFPIG